MTIVPKIRTFKEDSIQAGLRQQAGRAIR